LLPFRRWPTISNQYRVKGFINNREEILIAIKTIMVEMFEVDEEAITLEARLLCEDLDLDFDIIDAVI
jgi:acyl carrier protein